MFSHDVSPKIKLKGSPMQAVNSFYTKLGVVAVGAAVASSNAMAAADITVAAPTYDNLWYSVGIMAGVLITFAVGKKVLGYFRG